MTRYPHFFRWLGIAALLDWLVTRSLTRAAIHMPKTPLVIAIYQGLSLFGQIASTVASLLALVAAGWIAWQRFKEGKGWSAGLALFALIALSLWALFQPAHGWRTVLFQLLFIFCCLAFVMNGWSKRGTDAEKIALLLVSLALLVSHTFQLVPAVDQALKLKGPEWTTQALFNLGELLVVLSVVGMWWAYGRGAGWVIWLSGAVLSLLFALSHLLDPAMTGILVIWSTGLSLYLPWPLYAIALWLAWVTAITSLRRGQPAGWALLLLAAGGYAPQLSYQAFMGLAALWLLADSQGSTVGNTEPISTDFTTRD